MAVVVNELDITWKEVAVAYFDVLFRQNGGSKEVKKKTTSQDSQSPRCDLIRAWKSLVWKPHTVKSGLRQTVQDYKL